MLQPSVTDYPAEPIKEGYFTLSNHFRGHNNRLLTTGLFLEPTILRNRPTDDVVFTLLGMKELSEDRKERFPDIISAKDTYLGYGDITGSQWSKNYLEGFEHLERLMDSDWFVEEKTKWDKEIIAAQKAQAIQALLGMVSDSEVSDSVRVSAAKYIAEEGWTKANRATKGRPSKEAIAKEVKQQAKKITEAEQDAKRIGLRIVK